jgi:hypothetical protein
VIDSPAFQDAFETAARSIFRLERLQHYAGDPNFGRFLAGEPWEDTDSKRHWLDLVRRRTCEGVVMQRVHLVEEPWSDYVCFEIMWSYPPNITAGEEVRLASGSMPSSAEVGDFWLFDDRLVWAMAYDAEGVLSGVHDRSADQPFVTACRKAKRLVVRR